MGSHSYPTSKIHLLTSGSFDPFLRAYFLVVLYFFLSLSAYRKLLGHFNHTGDLRVSKIFKTDLHSVSGACSPTVAYSC